MIVTRTSQKLLNAGIIVTRTFTNCVNGALGLRDVVINILGSFSLALAYSSSMVDLGTKLRNKGKSCITICHTIVHLQNKRKSKE